MESYGIVYDAKGCLRRNNSDSQGHEYSKKGNQPAGAPHFRHRFCFLTKTIGVKSTEMAIKTFGVISRLPSLQVLR